MKIKITEDTKNVFYMNEMDALKIAETNLKECGGVQKDDIQMLADFVSRWNNAEVLKAEAEFAKNARTWERFGEGSRNTDVWVKLMVFDGWKTFYTVGAYLSDIWEIGGTDRNELEGRMFIQKFVRQ